MEQTAGHHESSKRFPKGAETNNEPIETDDVVVLLLGAPDKSDCSGYLEGITRVEKLIFLLGRETPLRDWLTEQPDFCSHKFGPFSSKVYQAVDTLGTAGLVRNSAKKSITQEDRWESIHVIGEDVDPHTIRTFELTDRGKRYYEALLNELPPNAEKILSQFKSRFGSIPLRQLVRYIYMCYPQFTDEPDIRNEVFR